MCSQHWWQENVREEDRERHSKSKWHPLIDWQNISNEEFRKFIISQPYQVWWALNEADKVFSSHRTQRTRASRWHCKPVKHGRVSLTWSNQLWSTTKNNRNNCRICAGHKQPGGTAHSMTTCTWPNLSNDDDGSYIAIFSALKQTHCTFVACDSKWVTAAFYSVLNVHWSGVFTALFGCYIAGALWNCCHLSICSMYTIQPCTMSHHFMQSHICRVHVLLYPATCTFDRMMGSFLTAGI